MEFPNLIDKIGMDKETAKRCLNIVKGCHDYNGGHYGETWDAFHHGIDTAIRCLEKFIEIDGDGSDIQLHVVETIGRRS